MTHPTNEMVTRALLRLCAEVRTMTDEELRSKLARTTSDSARGVIRRELQDRKAWA